LVAAVLAAAALVPAASSSGPNEIYRVTVWMQGQGTVTSLPRGVVCPGACTATFSPHARVRFTATPARGWRFLRWYVGCTGKKPVCVHEVTDGGITVGAAFTKR
jgi:hypothetical protein